MLCMGSFTWMNLEILFNEGWGGGEDIFGLEHLDPWGFLFGAWSSKERDRNRNWHRLVTT